MNEPPHPSPRQPGLPGLWLGLLLAGVLLLQGCSTRRAEKKEEAQKQEVQKLEGESAAPAAAAESLTFKVDVVSDNGKVARYLERYLDIQRFTDFPDLQENELRRLLGETESNARDLLAAIGYFNPKLELKAGDADADPGKKRRIVINVDPGDLAKIQTHDIRFAEPMASDEEGERQRRIILRDWLLQDGETFTQEGWDASKNAGLRVLQRLRYPTARIQASAATVNADTDLALLTVIYDAGPAYRFGSLELTGVERYDPQGIRNIARLPTGEVYSEETLLDIQQRMVTSGYFDSVFLTLDASEQNPGEAKVIAQLREARMQKIVFGLGFSTDTGPRLTVDHTHNEMPPLGWRALNHVTAGLQTQALSTNWTAMPNAAGWAWNTGLAVDRSDVGDLKTNSLSLTGGRSRNAGKTERKYYLQFDSSNSEGGDAPSSSSSLLGNYGWTGRYFNNRLDPTDGFGVGLDAGAGMTVRPMGKPFLRFDVRALELWPFGGRNIAGKRNRLSFRAEVGTIVATSDVEIPANLLFLTGGDTTVRGYSYQSIGEKRADGTIYGARNMGMASVEWQHPIVFRGDARSFETVVFADAGAAADRAKNAKIFPGVGAGLRWGSPMGPLELDVAYGTRTEKWRLHLRVGLQFE